MNSTIPVRVNDSEHIQAEPNLLTCIKRYALHWALTVILVITFFSLDVVTGFRREFSIYDETLHYTYATKERVSTGLLYIITSSPLLIMPIINFFSVRSWQDLHISSLSLMLGISVTGVFTQIVKLTVGRPRPDLIARCQLPPGVTQSAFRLTTAAICTQMDQSILRDGWRSFFSGHSSLSFSGLGFLTLYIAGKVQLFDGLDTPNKTWFSLTPLVVASLVAISRTMDYRHHWEDVAVGSLVGIAISYFAYRLYYPPLRSRHAEYPLSMLKPMAINSIGENLSSAHVRGESRSDENSKVSRTELLHVSSSSRYRDDPSKS